MIAESDPSGCTETLSELVLSVRGDIELEMCTDGRQAIEWMKKRLRISSSLRVDLPVDGLSLLRGIRNLRRRPPIPFILISNRSDRASVKFCRSRRRLI
ncbi:hypothetical protein ACTACD_02770 [Pseudomonas syringae]|uniref:hypothetical protein n=1 Tax=Pseudomonas syringae TaxID=317 RepID=UPI003F76DD0D